MDPLSAEDDNDGSLSLPKTSSSRFEEQKARFEQLLVDSRKGRPGDPGLPEFATKKSVGRPHELTHSLDIDVNYRKPMTAREPISRRSGIAPVTSTRLPALKREDTGLSNERHRESREDEEKDDATGLGGKAKAKSGWSTPRGQLPVSSIMPNKPKLPEILSFSRQGTEVIDRIKLTDGSNSPSTGRVSTAGRRQ